MWPHGSPGAGARPGRHQHGLGPRPPSYQAALTSIVLGTAARGAGILTSSMPFAYFASNLGGVDTLGEREAPLEPAVRDLADEVVPVGGVGVWLAFASDGEDVVHQGHRNVLRVHAWQGELDDIGAVFDASLRAGSHEAGR